MARVHSYSRFSHISQEDGDSKSRQDKALDKFLGEGGHTLSDLRLHDKARSAFRGNKQKYLTEFLQILRAKDGRIAAGDILFVEAVDRLSRKGIRPTQDVVNEILNAGVDIAISLPMEKTYKADKINDLGDAIELAAFSFAAHVYSDLLSGRVKSFHTQARKAAYATGAVINSGPTPCWLTRKDGAFSIVPGAREAIQYILRRMIEGAGGPTICKELNALDTPFPALGKSGHWNETFIRQLVVDRRILGEYRPHEIDDTGIRVPTSEPPLKGYYPAVTDEDTYIRANAARANRFIERGPTTEFVNLFTGLVVHAVDKCPANLFSYQQKRADGRIVKYRRLKSQNTMDGLPNSSTETVDIEAFEFAVLKHLRELDVNIFNGEDTQSEKLSSSVFLLKSKEADLKELQQQCTDSPKRARLLLPSMEALDDEIDALRISVNELKARSLNTATASLASFKTLEEVDNTSDNRQILREAIKRLVRQIAILPVKLGNMRRSHIGCHIEITFHSGSRRSLLQCRYDSIAYTEPSPTTPSLLERTDLEKHKAAILKTLTFLTANRSGARSKVNQDRPTQ